MAIRLGVIGAGSLGQAHIRSLARFEDVHIAAVCDRDRAAAEAAAKPFEAKAHINFRNLIESEHLDAVFVCLPAFSLGEPERLAARAGIHLFIEQPVALNVQKAREVCGEIENAGVIASVAHTWRQLSGAEKLKGMLSGRKVGMVLGWRFLSLPAPGWRRRREASGGLFMQAGMELLDVSRYLAGEVTSLCAMETEGIGAGRVSDCDIEDAAAVLLGFRGGAVGQIACADVPPYREEAELCVMADGLRATLTAEYLEVVEDGKTVREDHRCDSLHEAHGIFLEAVRRGKPELVRSSYADAVVTLTLALAARESIQSGKLVNL